MKPMRQGSTLRRIVTILLRNLCPQFRRVHTPDGARLELEERARL